MNWIKLSLVLVFLGLSLSVRAQYADVHMAKRRGARIELDGQKLSASQSALLMADIDGEDCSGQWNKARGWRSAGIAMISGGAAIAAGGAFVGLLGGLTSMMGATAGAVGGAIGDSISGGDSNEHANEGAQQGAQAGVPMMRAGLWVFVAGMGIHLAGVPITVVNSVKMSRLVNQYNEAQTKKAQEPEVQFSLGFTPNGVGLCLTF